ncbi:chemotaxis protein CheD [Imhoffiella purpurea]|uniref:Probable chemoreceptor glutamine deamidase CheD n=1 Tax=Imhoffiella purpurea TaxID=1249627 RepID=W9VBA1_9GAMM|nr:chemotaxis protein CheD [Imhoffiella purpurea]EXJ16848.1 Chemotaxis protein CheD [Imhoffiella purpurea]
MNAWVSGKRDLGGTRVRKRFLHPGEHYVTDEPMLISTLLGSCVSVCLFDPEARVIGMNHFLLPARSWPTEQPLLESDAGRYGLWAMELLVNGVLRLGGRRERLRAKAFGGANVLNVSVSPDSGREGIGSANARFVRQFLEQDAIPLVAQDLGGETGRQIHFYGGDFAVFLRRIPRLQAARIEVEERHYLHRVIQDKDRLGSADFF